MTKMAANQTTAILVAAMPAYERETNLEFAEQAISGNLKLLEGLLETTPHNEDLILLASRNYTCYAFGFIEEKIDRADEEKNFERKEKLIENAVDFYRRGRKYGLQLIALSRKKFHLALEQGIEELASELDHFNKRDIPGLFWTAYAWGNMINLQQDNPKLVAEIPKVILMMQRVLELDEDYFFGGGHLFFGVYYGSRPQELGGNPLKAKHHFERAIEINDGKYLMAKFLLVKYYAVSVQDREMFDQTLQEIRLAPSDLFPEQGLANKLAKRYAERWIGRIDEFFF
ncbi:MAG: hypothetical protein JSV84_17530 [Gemmatimonadota bacterium]|nr:MAG: hypothetical protein JSV84_17530 [Gemmatimonadota bacterium]